MVDLVRWAGLIFWAWQHGRGRGKGNGAMWTWVLRGSCRNILPLSLSFLHVVFAATGSRGVGGRRCHPCPLWFMGLRGVLFAYGIVGGLKLGV
jgi:hypothetical protein